MSIRVNDWNQRECRHCHNLAPLFHEEIVNQQHSDRFSSRTLKHHTNFNDLDHCASNLGCVACQVFRRAVLLETATETNKIELNRTNAVDSTTIRLHRRGSDRWLVIEVPTATRVVRTVTALSPSNTARIYPTLKTGKPLDSDRLTRLSKWITECHEMHSCANFAYSRSNPTWLVRILSQNYIELVSGKQCDHSNIPLRYVSLSYCWGSREAITRNSPRGWERVERSATTDANLKSRQQPFPVTDLVQTLQDAIAVVRGLGIEYIWIDTVCVPQGTWHTEANRMHEIYGNAYFTLSSSGAAQATDHMLSDLGAWIHPNRGCRLHGLWIMNVDTPLDVIRTRSATAVRGWTLQEERLSPRVLYWCNQRAYWSCCANQRIEAKQPGGFPQDSYRDALPHLSHPQLFMQLCRAGDVDRLPEEWADLVSSFARRYLSEFNVVENRFAAFSGLATRYLRSTSTRYARNEYLAGLWRFSIGQSLTWRVDAPVEHKNSLYPHVPSWSWLSLPLGTDLHMPPRIDESPHFSLQMDSRVSANDSDVEIVRKGALIDSLIVSGRVRLFVEDTDAIKVPWDGIERQSGQASFDFSLNPLQPLFSRNAAGRVLVYEAHQAEVIAQLDYRVPDGPGQVPEHTLHVDEGREKDLLCFEVGSQHMLLLQSMDADKRTFCRAGVCTVYRKNFFDNAQIAQIILI